MMEAVRTSETSVDNYFTRQYIPEDNSEHHTRRRENLKSHLIRPVCFVCHNRKFGHSHAFIFFRNDQKDPYTSDYIHHISTVFSFTGCVQYLRRFAS
jgi:hypothetical protein